jgi:putative methionine-R-sulfoxide reductase with GAF domain
MRQNLMQKREDLRKYAQNPQANQKIIKEREEFYKEVENLCDKLNEALEQSFLKGLDIARRNQEPNRYRNTEQFRQDHAWKIRKTWGDHY